MVSAIKPRGVVHFSIPVSDLEVSKTFYTELLGLTFLRHSPAFGMVFLSAGKDYITLCESETPIQPNPEGGRFIREYQWFIDNRLVAKTTGLVDVLRESLWPLVKRIEVATVFGSIALSAPM